MVAKLSVRLIGALALAIMLGLAVLQVPWVQSGISRGLTAALSEPGEFEVRIDGFGGFLPFSVRADELALVDSAGQWLSVSSLRLDLIPSELWRGRIMLRRARAEHMRLARLPVGSDSGEPGEVPAFLRALLVGDLHVFDLRVGPALLLVRRGGDNAADSQQTRWSPPAEVRARGRYYFQSRSVNAELAVTLDAVESGSLPIDDAGVSAVGFDLAVSGTLQRPVLKAHLEIDGARLSALSAKRVDAVLEVKPEGAQSAPALAMTLAIETHGVDSSDVRWRQLLGDSPALDARAVLEPDVERLVLHSAQLSSGAAKVALHGKLESMRELVLQAEAELADLSALSGLVSEPIEGRGEVHASVKADLSSGVASTDATVSLRDFGSRSATMQALVGDRVRVVGHLARSENGELRVDDFELSAAGAEVSGHLHYHPASQRVSGLVAARVSDVFEFARASGSQAEGDLSVSAQVEGALDDLEIDVALLTNGLTFGESSLVAGRLGVRARGSLESATGDASMLLASGSTEASASADFSWASAAGLELTDVHLDASRAHLNGALSVSARDRLVTGQLHASAEDLSLFAPLVQFALGGSATLEADFDVEEGRQLVDVRVVGEGIVAQPRASTRIELAHGKLDVRVSDALGEPLSNLSLQASGGRFGDVVVDNATLEMAQEGKRWQTRGEVSGRYFDPFEIATSCLYESIDDGWRIVVDSLDGSVADSRVSLKSPVKISAVADLFAIEGLDLDVAEGRISGDWDELSGPRARGRIRVSNLPLDVVGHYLPSFDVRGRVSGELNGEAGQSSSGDPVLATLWLAGDRLEIVPSRRGEVPPIQARLDLQRYPAGLSVRMAVDTGVGEGLGLVAQVPLTESTNARSIAADRNREVVGHIEGQAKLDGLVALGEDAIHGEVTVDLALSGTLDDPRLRGSASVVNGVYASAATGVAYRDIALDVGADGLRLRLDSLTASDGHKGRLRASGDLDLSAAMDASSYRFAVELEKMRILNLDELEVRAGGVLDMVGGAGVPKISGRLDVAKAEVTLPERLPPEIVTLEVVETNTLYKRPSRVGGKGAPPPVPIELDVRLVAASKVFVRNRDFDSEWKGDVVVGGNTVAPTIDGGLTLVRGELAALGLRLKATRGNVGFSAGEKIDPTVDIVAESTANGITARVIVSGRASDPVLSLESDPPLPPDEIASRLLFGDTPGQLSPAQSLQLAQALARLSGRGGVDPLGWIRRTAGLDLLQINSGEEGVETSVVSVGKYIKRGVFVSINQGFASQSSTANVAVDVTDHIKVESEVGSNSTSSIGVTWGWDY